MVYISLLSELGFDFNEHVKNCKKDNNEIGELQLIEMSTEFKKALSVNLDIGSLNCVQDFEPKNTMFLSDIDNLVGLINSELHLLKKEVELILY